MAIGTSNWQHGATVDSWHPLLFIIVSIGSYFLGRSRFRIGTIKTTYIISFLVSILWLVAGNPLINIAIVFGSAYLLWYFRSQLSLTVITYDFCSLVVVFTTEKTESAERYVYRIVSIAIAYGILLSRYPQYGYIAIAFFSFTCYLCYAFFLRYLGGLDNILCWQFGYLKPTK